jgi:hypothetical protein
MTSGAIAGFLDVAFNFNTQALLGDNLISKSKLRPIHSLWWFKRIGLKSTSVGFQGSVHMWGYSSQVIVSRYPDSASTNYWVVVVLAIPHTAI